MEIVVWRRQPLISKKLRLQMCFMVIPFGRFLFNKKKYYLADFLIQATMDFSGWPRLPEITSFSSTTYRKNRQERTCQKILIPWYWDGSQRGTLRGLSKHSIKSFSYSFNLFDRQHSTPDQQFCSPFLLPTLFYFCFDLGVWHFWPLKMFLLANCTFRQLLII